VLLFAAFFKITTTACELETKDGPYLKLVMLGVADTATTRQKLLKREVVVGCFLSEQQQAVSLDEEKIVFPPNI